MSKQTHSYHYGECRRARGSVNEKAHHRAKKSGKGKDRIQAGERNQDDVDRLRHDTRIHVAVACFVHPCHNLDKYISNTLYSQPSEKIFYQSLALANKRGSQS